MRRFLRGRIHKRPFVVTTAVLGLFLVAGVSIVFYLGFFQKSTQTEQIIVKSGSAGNEINGIGLNINTIPTPNMVSGASFEDSAQDRLFTVYEGAENYVYLLQDHAGSREYADGSFAGGDVRIMSLDEQGKMVQKLVSRVVAFDEIQFGPLARIDTDAAISSNIVFIQSSSVNTVAFSSEGQYVSDLTTASRQTFSVQARSPIVAFSEAGGRYCALASDWSIYTSTDGKNFNSYISSISVPSIAQTVISVDRTIIAAGDSGAIIILSDGDMLPIESGTDADLTTSCSDGKTALLAGSEGVMITTSNGMIFRKLTAEELPFPDRPVQWICSTWNNGRYILAGSSGELAIGEYDSVTGRFRFDGFLTMSARGESIFAQSVIVDASGEIILLGKSGRTYILSANRLTWKELLTQSAAPVKAIARASDGKIVLFRDGSFFSTRILTRVEYEEHLTDTAIRAGDMCFLRSDAPVFDGISRQSADGRWQAFGTDVEVQIVDDAPANGGKSSLKLFGSNPGTGEARFVSQVLNDDRSAVFVEKTFYRIELWLKQNGMRDGEVMVWLSGEFESVGTVFTEVGNNWRHYSALIVLPAKACGDQAGEIRLNVGFSGKGDLFVDRVYFGPDKYSSEMIPENYRDQISDMSPSFIRLSNVAFGKTGVASESYYYPVGNESDALTEMGEYVSRGCISLESSLRMTKQAGASPWLVIDSAAAQDQVKNLIEYFCGSISEPFGKMRIDNGTAVPWSTQFERVVFEVADSRGLFATDLQKGAYVDYMIGIMKSSPHYLDIKDRVIFLDGMDYTGGSMLSEADYHTAYLHISGLSDDIAVTGGNPSSIEIISAGYLNYYDRIPRILSRPRENIGEWIGSSGYRILNEQKTQAGILRNDTRVSAAAYVDYLLHDLGWRTSVLCVDVPFYGSEYDYYRGDFRAYDAYPDRRADVINENIQVLISSLTALNGAVSGSPLDVRIVPASRNNADGDPSEITTTEESQSTAAYAFINLDSVSVIITNTGDQPKQFRVETEFRITAITVDHYSDSGEQIVSSDRKSRNNLYTLLPGQFLVIKGKATD
ncbi:MAG: hypothetical protein GX099_04955 [Clostridiaceae bacterium]|nr:hypothetical protein [Oscillospiraceae bacterium]NLO62759.1 hypothetical protein [Clostridiaceae bacterium]